MLTRRSFLVGATGLLTAAFVKDARSFVSRTRQPLLEAPPEVAQTLYWYDNGNSLLLTVDAYQLEPPPLPTWRTFLVSEGIPHATEDEAYSVWADHAIWPEDYDEPVNARYWHDWFNLVGGPCAKAYQLLDGLDLGPDLGSPRQGPHLAFEEGAYPGDNSRWVQASGKLALSLLQARLIDLRLPIAIVEGARCTEVCCERPTPVAQAPGIFGGPGVRGKCGAPGRRARMLVSSAEHRSPSS